MTIEEKKQRIQPGHPDLSIQRQCELYSGPQCQDSFLLKLSVNIG